MTESVSTVSSYRSFSSEIDRHVIAAIDFGTSGSGFAFAYSSKISQVHVNKWILRDSETKKAPTTVLLKSDKTFDSFGYEAESKYAELCVKSHQKGWRYFQDFKMALYNRKKITKDMEILDLEKNPMPAGEVFSAALAYLKKELLKAIRLQKDELSDDDVLYVITVPAIWSDAAKQFMREAATNKIVGITDDQLRLVLEPEAAAVYCAQIPYERSHCGRGSFQPPTVGSRYILVDLGGGTVDIATHEVHGNGLLLQLHEFRGDDHGGQYFNRQIEVFLKKMFGKKEFEEWETNNYEDVIELRREIEGFKKTVGNTDSDVKLEISDSLETVFREYQGYDINSKQTTESYNHAVKSCKNNKLELKNAFLKQYLEHIADAIVEQIKAIANNTKPIQTIFLVGGLAKSVFIETFIQSKFRHYSVVVPEDANVAVLKGAVLLGNRPQIIAGRIATYTYGVCIAPFFKDGEHREEYKFTRDGYILCRNVFKKLIRKGKLLEFGDKFTVTTHICAKLPETKHETFTTEFYQSTEESPEYITDDGCTKLGGFKETPPEGGWPDYCETTIEIVVGEAELKFYVKDGLGREYETKMDFLLPVQ